MTRVFWNNLRRPVVVTRLFWNNLFPLAWMAAKDTTSHWTHKKLLSWTFWRSWHFCLLGWTVSLIFPAQRQALGSRSFWMAWNHAPGALWHFPTHSPLFKHVCSVLGWKMKRFVLRSSSAVTRSKISQERVWSLFSFERVCSYIIYHLFWFCGLVLYLHNRCFAKEIDLLCLLRT